MPDLPDDVQAALTRLNQEFAALAGPTQSIRSPATPAVAWFRSQWSVLAGVPALLADDDAELVGFAMAAVPFLVESDNWAGLVDVTRAGADAAARLSDESTHRHLLQFLAGGLQHTDRFGAAAELFEQIAADAVARGDSRTEAAALAHLGQLRRRMGEPREGAAQLQRSVLAYRRAGYRIGEARASGDLARVLVQLGNDDEAARYAERARRLFHDAGDRAGEARVVHHLAGHAAERGEVEEALHLLAEATALYDGVDDAGGAAEALEATARLHLQAGDHERARRAAQDALARADAAGDPVARDLAALVELTTSLTVADALLDADSDEARGAVVGRHPEVLGPEVLLLLEHRRRGVADDTIERDRLDAALSFLRAHPSGSVAAQVRARLDELRSLVAPPGQLPAQLPDLLTRLAVADDPADRVALLTAVLDGLPAALAAVRGHVLLDLADAVDRAQHAPADRDRAIALAQEAAGLLDRDETRVRWAQCQVWLGSALRQREAGDPADLDRAIAAFGRALSVYHRDSHPLQWASTTVNLANAHWRRRTGSPDLQQAVRLHTEALPVLTREEHPGRWAAVQSNIGLVLTDPVLASDPDNLEAGRRHLLDAIAMAELEPAARAGALINLARCHRDRLAGDPEENLAAAVRFAVEAYEIRSRTDGPVDLAIAANAVGDVVGNAALHAGRGSDEAVHWFEEALRLISPTDSPLLYAGMADNLANALVQLDEVTSDDVQRALELHLAALRVYSDGGDPLEEARACYNIAATLRRIEPTDHASAIAFLERSQEIRTPDLVPLEWAESATELARAWLDRPDAPDPQRAANLLREVVATIGTDSATGHARRAWSLLGAAEAELGSWTEAAAAYEQALAAGERRYRTTVLPGGRDAELLHTADIAREGAYASAAAGDPQRAVLVLETARARALGDRLERDRADLQALEAAAPAEVASFHEASWRIRAVEARLRAGPASEAEATRRLRAELTDGQAQLDAAVDRIRRHPGFAYFLRSSASDVLAATARPALPLAYLTVARHGALALLVSVSEPGASPTIEAIPGGLTDDVLVDAMERFVPHADPGIAPLLDLLGEGLVAPLARRLRERAASGVVLVATGALGVLPVHAARYGDPPRHLLDEFDVTYAPSARVLHAARTARLAAAGRPVHLVGVAEPQPCDPPLPWAGPELAAVARLHEGTVHVVPGREATASAVLAALRGASHLHFAGHGSYDPEEPLRSALILARGERLTLRRLLDGTELDGVRLVVASACQTAITDMTRVPDEAVGLPAGLVQAGAAAVIGTLWEVNDRSTALLVTRFYVNHLRGDPDHGGAPMSPARALAAAQRWLATTDLRDIDRFAASIGLRRARTPTLSRGRATRSPAAGAPSRPFADPLHWAAFVLVGDGE